MSFSTSASVRCSRPRSSLFGRRNGPTARFWEAGFTSRRLDFVGISHLLNAGLLVQKLFYEQSCWVVGVLNDRKWRGPTLRRTKSGNGCSRDINATANARCVASSSASFSLIPASNRTWYVRSYKARHGSSQTCAMPLLRRAPRPPGSMDWPGAFARAKSVPEISRTKKPFLRFDLAIGIVARPKMHTPKADMCSATRDVRFVPIAASRRAQNSEPFRSGR